MTSLTRKSKFYANSRSVRVLKNGLNLGLGVGRRGKLEYPNICHANTLRKIMITGLFCKTGQYYLY